MMLRALACSQPQRALPLLHRQWQQIPLAPARRGLSSAPAPGGGGGSGGSCVGGGRGPRGLRLFSVPGGWRMARKSEEELAAEIEAGSGSQRFPFKDEFEVARGVVLNAEQVVETLQPLMTAERIERIEQVCASRTFNVLPILEAPYDLGNLAAVCRSGDALGFGAVHIIRNMEDTRFKQSRRSSAGADKWLDVQVFDSAQDCLMRAKRMGYQIVATHLRADAVDISEVDWTRPTAFVMGNEEKGVSPEVLELADACAVVPMAGFVESFNISVAAALIMYEARRSREQKLGAHGDLTPEEQALLKAVFFLRNKGQAKEYIQHLLERPPPEWQKHRGGGNWGGKVFSYVSDDEAASGTACSSSGGCGEAEGSTAGSSSASSELPSSSGGSESEREDELPRHRLQTTQCYCWDGTACWSERYLYPGKPCRYHESHNEGVNTLNKERLLELCARKGLAAPDFSNPPPMPQNLAVMRQRRAAAAAAAAEAAAAAAAAEKTAQEAHAALLAAAAAAAASSGQPEEQPAAVC
ncbi:RNA methylase [Chlorella sorokiniana]|uniref:RNA methylase n=1 Tax=Chlorella sorokiniana TaxID=3076 RepID=A0A2P6TUL2_CHLSO|nr:RNA methylase [Chlorella sorokiniana]|eukprot:PRW57757.1 RNA methylase [Chlorella sorokiniana]